MSEPHSLEQVLQGTGPRAGQTESEGEAVLELVARLVQPLLTLEETGGALGQLTNHGPPNEESNGGVCTPSDCSAQHVSIEHTHSGGVDTDRKLSRHLQVVYSPERQRSPAATSESVAPAGGSWPVAIDFWTQATSCRAPCFQPMRR